MLFADLGSSLFRMVQPIRLRLLLLVTAIILISNVYGLATPSNASLSKREDAVEYIDPNDVGGQMKTVSDRERTNRIRPNSPCIDHTKFG